MHHPRPRLAYAASTLALTVFATACLPGSDAPSPTGKLASKTVGSLGGTISTEHGVQLVIPPEALSEDVEITITGLGKIDPPEGSTAIGGGYLFEPENVYFSVPVRVTLPIAGPYPEGTRIMVGRQHEEGSDWELLEGELTDTTVTAQTHAFSRWVAVIVDPHAADKYRSGEDVNWTRQFGLDTADEVTAVAVAPDDSILAVGLTYGGFEGFEQGGNGDAFVRKYDGQGNVLWTKQFGFGSTEHALAVTSNEAGTLFVAGTALHLLDPDSENVDYERAGGAFVRSYGSSGDLNWSFQLKRVGTISEINALAVSGDHLVIVGGQDAKDMFVKKVDNAGNLIWGDVLDAQEGESANSFDSGCDVALDGGGAVLALGQMNGPLAGFSTQSGVVVRKYDSSGVTLWTKVFELDGCASGGSILSDGDFVYVVTNAGVRKLDADGKLLWEKSVWPLGFTQGALTSAGDVVVTGYTSDIPPVEGDGWDIVVRRYDPEGEELWTRQVGSPGSDDPHALAVDSADRIYLGGRSIAPPGTLTGVDEVEGSGAFLMQMKP